MTRAISKLKLIAFILMYWSSVVSADQRATLVTLDRREIQIAPAALNFPKPLELSPGEQPGGFDWTKVDYLSFHPRKVGEATGTWLLTTHGGGQSAIEIIGGDERVLRVRDSLLGELLVPMDRLARLVRKDQHLEGLHEQVDEDFLLLTSGDRVKGVVVRFSQDGLVFFDGDSERKAAWALVKALAMSGPPPRASTVEEDRSLRAMIFLTNDSRLLVDTFTARDRLIEASPSELDIQSMPDDHGGVKQTSIRIPIDQIRRIEVLGGRRTWLSTVRPTDYQMTPYFDIRWPYRVDRNVLGGPLRMQGRTYERGVGLHSACRIAWRIEDRHTRLRCRFGIDDTAGPLADVMVRILLGDQEIVAFDRLRQGEAPRELDIPLPIDRTIASFERLLTFEVEFGANGDIHDRVNIVDAALIADDMRSDAP